MIRSTQNVTTILSPSLSVDIILLPRLSAREQQSLTTTVRSPSHPRQSPFMAREKSPGLKILWLWTFGTAAVLVTSVMRTRMQDMEKLMNAAAEPDHPPQRPPSDAVLLLDPSPEQPDQALRGDSDGDKI
ncbi:hypothetical protein BT93_B1114 [Corymbia citriodora subsp. variegata]|nr:hypothetical protein BT93_B1114 [Corymbia citriodora subsp. variegata]